MKKFLKIIIVIIVTNWRSFEVHGSYISENRLRRLPLQAIKMEELFVSNCINSEKKVNGVV